MSKVDERAKSLNFRAERLAMAGEYGPSELIELTMEVAALAEETAQAIRELKGSQTNGHG